METVVNETSGFTASEASARPANEVAISPNALSALGYFCGIVAIVTLCTQSNGANRSTRFHAFQALLFQAAWIVGYLAIATVMGILGILLNGILGALGAYAVLGIFLAVGPLLSAVFSLAMLVTWVVLIVSAAQGKTIKLPFVGRLAEQLSGR